MFPAHPSAVYQIRQFVRGHADEAALSRDGIDDLVLAATEASTNSLRHTVTEWIELAWYATEDQVEVLVRDDGLFGQRIPLRGLDTEGGFGVRLMMALMDEVHIYKGSAQRPGTAVRLVKYR
jgi:serine/threonine-protein kinase RsbW